MIFKKISFFAVNTQLLFKNRIINKKCVTEATHEKHIAPLSPNKNFQLSPKCVKIEACIFTEIKIHTKVNIQLNFCLATLF